MPGINTILLSCTGLFEPVSYYSLIYATNHFIEPAQQSIALFKTMAQANNLIFAETSFSGFAQSDKIIIPEEPKIDINTMRHERFHVKIYKQAVNLGCGFVSRVIEESFAEAYSKLHIMDREKENRLIFGAETARSEFNRLMRKKKTKGIEGIIAESLPQCTPYLLRMFNLQYNAYADLAIKMFKQHGAQKTVYHTAVACDRAETAGDHRIGIGYLNNTLLEKERITNQLDIKSLYADMEALVDISADGLSYDLYGQINSVPCTKLAEAVFELFCPFLLMSKTDPDYIYPSHFLSDYYKRKRKLNK